jgi:hypothetical protein
MAHNAPFSFEYEKANAASQNSNEKVHCLDFNLTYHLDCNPL